jgi:hypothetical protein
MIHNLLLGLDVPNDLSPLPDRRHKPPSSVGDHLLMELCEIWSGVGEDRGFLPKSVQTTIGRIESGTAAISVGEWVETGPRSPSKGRSSRMMKGNHRRKKSMEEF